MLKSSSFSDRNLILKNILTTLNINYETHKQFLNDLCKNKLKRIADISPRKEQKIIDITVEYKNSSSLDCFFSSAKKEITTYLAANNYSQKDIISVCQNNHSVITIKIMVLEHKNKTTKRASNAKKINTLLDNYSEILRLSLLK
jgi:hypothetical protein